eukprot:512550-Hanusia_phi.AAC.2
MKLLDLPLRLFLQSRILQLRAGTKKNQQFREQESDAWTLSFFCFCRIAAFTIWRMRAFFSAGKENEMIDIEVSQQPASAASFSCVFALSGHAHSSQQVHGDNLDRGGGALVHLQPDPLASPPQTVKRDHHETIHREIISPASSLAVQLQQPGHQKNEECHLVCLNFDAAQFRSCVKALARSSFFQIYRVGVLSSERALCYSLCFSNFLHPHVTNSLHQITSLTLLASLRMLCT